MLLVVLYLRNGLFGIKAQFGRVPVFPAVATPTLAQVRAAVIATVQESLSAATVVHPVQLETIDVAVGTARSVTVEPLPA